MSVARNKVASVESTRESLRKLSVSSHMTAIPPSGDDTGALVLSIQENPSVAIVCQRLARTGQSVCVFIDETQSFKGLLTASDITRNVVAAGLNPNSVSSVNIMKKDILTIVEGSEKDTLERRAMEVMVRCALQYIPITDVTGRFLRVLDVVQILESKAPLGRRRRCSTASSIGGTGSKRTRGSDASDSLENDNTKQIPKMTVRLSLATLSQSIVNKLDGLRKQKRARKSVVAFQTKPLKMVKPVDTLQEIARLMKQDSIPACVVTLLDPVDNATEFHLITDRLFVEAVSFGVGMVAKNGPTISGFIATLRHRGQEDSLLGDIPLLQDHHHSPDPSREMMNLLEKHRVVIFRNSESDDSALHVVPCLEIARRHWVRANETSADRLNGKSRLLRRLSLSSASMSASSSNLMTSISSLPSQLSSRSLTGMIKKESSFRASRERAPHLVRMPSGRTAALTKTAMPLVPSPKSKKQLEKAAECFRKRDFNGSLKHYTQYLDRNPLDGLVFLKRAILLQNQLQNQEDAVRDFRQALETNHLSETERREALILLCVALLELRKLDEATCVWNDFNIGSAEEVVAHGVIKYVIGSMDQLMQRSMTALEDSREYEKAVRVVTNAVELGDFILTQRNLSFPVTSSENCDQDNEEEERFTMQQSMSTALLIQSKARLRLGMLEAALEDVRRALELVPSNSVLNDHYLLVVHAMDLQARIVMLSTEIEKAQLQNDSAELSKAMFDRARVSVSQGCFVRASRDYRQGLRALSNSGGVVSQQDDSLLRVMIPALRDYGEDLNDILSVHVQHRAFDRVYLVKELTPLPSVRAAVDRFIEERIAAYLNRGMEFVSSLQFQQGYREFSLGIELCQEFEQVCLKNKEICSELYLSRCRCSIGFREYKAAIQDCDAAIFLHPTSEKAWIYKCQSLFELGDNDAFIRCAMDIKRRFGMQCHTDIAELVAKAMAVVPDEAMDAGVNSDDLFSLSSGA